MVASISYTTQRPVADRAGHPPNHHRVTQGRRVQLVVAALVAVVQGRVEALDQWERVEALDQWGRVERLGCADLQALLERRDPVVRLVLREVLVQVARLALLARLVEVARLALLARLARLARQARLV